MERVFNKEGHQGPIAVNYSCEVVRLSGNVTVELERHLLSQQGDFGKMLIDFEMTSPNQFTVTFERTKLIDEEMEKALMEGHITFEQLKASVQVTPWVIYYYQDIKPDLYIAKGERFMTIRPVADYANYFASDDPVQLVDIRTGALLGKATINSIKSMKLKHIKPEDTNYKGLLGRRADGVAEVKKKLKAIYEQDFSDDTPISIILMTADEEIGKPPSLLKNVLNRVRRVR